MKKTKYTKKRYTKYTKKRYTKNNKKTHINKIKRKIGGANNNTDKDIKTISYSNKKISVEFTDTFKLRAHDMYQINIEGIIINLTLSAGMTVYDYIKPDKIKEICSKKSITENSAFKMIVNILSNKMSIYRRINISKEKSARPSVDLLRNCKGIQEAVAAARARAAAAARARPVAAAAPAAARARAGAAGPPAEVANVEREDKADDFLKKVKEHNDYCTDLNSEYELKHKELGTIMSYLREILKEMPEIKAGDRIIYEIIHSLDFLSFGDKLDLNTMRIEQDDWIAQAAANSKKILSSLKEYKRLQEGNNRAPGPIGPEPGPATLLPTPPEPPAPPAPPAPSKTPEEIIEEWTKSDTWKKYAVKYAREKGYQINNNILADYITSFGSVGGRFTCDANSQDLGEGFWGYPPQWGWRQPCEKLENIQPINNNYSLKNIIGQQNIQSLYDNKLYLDNNGNYYIHEPDYILTIGMCTEKEINNKNLNYIKIINFIKILQKNILKLYEEAHNDINVDIRKPIEKVDDYFKNTDTKMGKGENYYLYEYIKFFYTLYNLVSHDTVRINEKQLIYDMILLLNSYYYRNDLETSSQSIIKKYLRTSV